MKLNCCKPEAAAVVEAVAVVVVVVSTPEVTNYQNYNECY
jgi:hypothetical protein